MLASVRTLLLIWLISLIGFTACSIGEEEPATAVVGEPTVAGPAVVAAAVESIEIQQVESFPVEVKVIANGSLPDNCATINQVNQTLRGGSFTITIDVIRPANLTCSTIAVPFEKHIPLDVLGLPAGIYTVDVNGLMGTFTLQVDNVADEGNAVIGGRVWQDTCSVEGAGGQGADVPTGCVLSVDGRLVANGLFEAGEPGLEGIVVDLGQGNCPATGLATTITDQDGIILFSGLEAGTYCVSVDSLNEQNVLRLSPGEWTYPAAVNQAGLTISLDRAENNLNANFGWHYAAANMAEAEASESECTDKAIFIADVTIPDDTVFSAGESFTKTWRLENIGSCTWTPGYSLVPVEGDPLGAAEFVSVSTTVEPGATADFSVKLTAPAEPGTYRSDWKLRNPKGFLFGIGPGSDKPFWLQIVVE